MVFIWFVKDSKLHQRQLEKGETSDVTVSPTFITEEKGYEINFNLYPHKTNPASFYSHIRDFTSLISSTLE